MHQPGLKDALLTAALARFFEVRETPGLKKPPSTSEMLDWLKLILAEDLAPDDLRRGGKDALPPLHGALLKTEADVHLLERLAFLSRAGADASRTHAMTHAFGIRPPEAADRTAWGRLWTDYLIFYETWRPQAHHDAYFARLLAREPADMQGLLALRDGAPIALAHWCLHPHGWQAEPVCYLQDLYTDPAARGAGAGAALIAAVAEASTARGARGLYWTTARDNAPARRLYDRVARLTPFVKYEL